MTQTSHAQLVVIGGGPGGYPAALEAASLGMNVVLVDQDPKLGGVCLQRGCIPSKTLLHASDVLFDTREATEWGFHFAEPTIDLDGLRAWKDGVVEKLSGGVAHMCKAAKVEVVQARARFVSSNELTLTSEDGTESRLTFDHAILASGSRPVVPASMNIDDPRVMDSTGALELADIPQSLLVIGGGYIGLELGTVYAALGSKVTCVEMMPNLLPGADRDLVRPLAKQLKDLFEAILLKTAVKSMTATDAGIVVEMEGEAGQSTLTFDRVLISIGRRPNSEDLGLENTQVEVDERGFVKIDSRLQTSDERILAIGDVAGQPMLAHKATREGKVAAQVLAGEPAEFDNVAIPAVMFTNPEIAWCGLTEDEAKASGRKVKVGRFSWKGCGRAVAIGRTEGMTKVIADPETQRVLGVAIVGPGAGDMIAEGVLAVETGMTVRDLAETIHPHPTLSETVMDAAERLL